jgi:hypothetical protein
LKIIKNVESLALDYVFFADTGNPCTTDSFRPFDIAFEQSSGKLVIIYDKDVSDTNDFYCWRTYYDGSTLSSESGSDGYIGSSADSEEIRYIRMRPKRVQTK